MPNIIKYLFFQIEKSGLITSLSAVALVFSISKLLDQKLSYIFLIIILTSSIIIYLFDFIFDRIKLIGLLGKILCLLLLLALLLLNFGLIIGKNNVLLLFVYSVFMFLSLIYAPFTKKISRKIIGFKDFYVTICWAFITPLFVLYHHDKFSAQVIFLIFLIFSRDFINVSYCDIKDINDDTKNHIRTLANILGPKKMVRYIMIISFVSIFIVIIGVAAGFFSLYYFLLLLPILFTAWLVLRSKQSKIFSSANVDFEYIFWAILLIIFHGGI